MSRHFYRALVTGGAGFLGSHVCDHLLRRDTEVLCVDNFVTGVPANVAHLVAAPGFRVVEHDVTRPLPCHGEFDLVLHLACPASPRDYQRLAIETLLAGAEGTRQVLEFAEARAARFVLASTSEVYGDPERHPQPETYWGRVNPVGPRSMYDEAKRYAEALTSAWRRTRGADTAIARIFNTYGPRMRPDDGRMVPTFIRQALAGEEITVAGDGRQTRSLCHVDDMARGLLALAESDLAGPVNLGNPVERSVREIAGEIRELAGSSSAVRHVEAAPDDPVRRCPDISLARAELGWEPRVSLRDGLVQTIASFRGSVWPSSARVAV